MYFKRGVYIIGIAIKTYLLKRNHGVYPFSDKLNSPGADCCLMTVLRVYAQRNEHMNAFSWVSIIYLYVITMHFAVLAWNEILCKYVFFYINRKYDF